MSVTWHILSITDGRTEVAGCYPTLDDCVRDMQVLAWEDAGNHWLDFVTDDGSGEVVAVAMYGPAMEMPVTLADGLRLVFEMPDSYKE